MKLAFASLAVCALCACALFSAAPRPEAAQAQATAAVVVRSSAAVTAKRGPRHVGLRVLPAADGGAPGVELDVDDGPDEIEGAALGLADAGATADAGAAAAAPPATSGLWWKWAAAGVVLAVILFALLRRFL